MAVDLFDVLKKIDSKDRLYYDNLIDQDKKGFPIFILNRWLSCCSSANQVFIVNEILNPYIFSLSKHPGLLYKLMTCVTNGKRTQYKFIKKTSSSNNTNSLNLIKQYFKYNYIQAKLVLNTLKSHDILLLGEEMGYSEVELNKVRSELGLPEIKVSKSNRT